MAINKRIEKLEIICKDKIPKEFVIAWQQHDNENLYELGHTGKMLTAAEFEALELGDNVIKMRVTYDREVNNGKS